jgi:hypothetical protein
MNVVIVGNANPSGKWASVSKVILLFTQTTHTQSKEVVQTVCE